MPKIKINLPSQEEIKQKRLEAIKKRRELFTPDEMKKTDKKHLKKYL